MDRIRRVPLVRLLVVTSQFEHGEICSTAETLRGNTTLRSRCCTRLETFRPGHNYRDPEGSQLRNPGGLIFLPPLLSRDVALAFVCVCVCVASSNAAPARHGNTTASSRHLHPAGTASRRRRSRTSAGGNTTLQVALLRQESSHDTGSSAESFGTGKVALRQYH